MNEKMLWQYARLVIGVGVNLQKNQTLVVGCPVECAYFARMLTDAAYEAGAKDVIINWRDDYCSRQRWLHADDSLFDNVYPWDSLQRNTLGREGAAYVAISASNPENLKGVDPEKIRKWEIAAGREMKEYYSLQMSNGFPWCVVSIPVISWAKKVFPGLTDDEAMNKLWDEIFKAVRITEDGDAVAEWKAHCSRLETKANELNEYRFKSLHYTNSLGTDLTVGMPEDHVWIAGGDTAKSGIRFVANMPTEEVFSAPLRNSINGVLYASKPLVLNGTIVNGIRFTFKDGRIVEIHADEGEDVLKSAVGTDGGSHYLGEIALVPYDSPISNSGILFFNTLFDENASCHFAFGKAYPSCIKGGDDMGMEEIIDHGINGESNTHVDFMVGTDDLSIIGTTQDGREIPVMNKGNWS